VDTRLRGDIAEAAVLRTLTEAGLLVLTPFGRFGPYDLVAEVAAGEFVRIQVKSGRVRKGCIEFNCCGTDHGNGRTSYEGRADVFAVHVHETGQQYIVPVDEAMGSKLYLRLAPTANNQRLKIRWAADYHVDDWLDRVTSSATARA
jgi:hypothetical protein